MTDKLFEIFKIGRSEAEKIASDSGEAHHHDYEELLIGIEGALEHFIDFRTEVIEAPYISFITKGKTHRLVPRIRNEKCEVWVIRFNSEFIPEITFQLYSLYHDDANVVMKSGFCFERIITLCDMMHSEMQRENPDYAILRHLLSALFIMIESDRKRSDQSEEAIQKTQNVTFGNFLKILEENFHRPLGVDFYAEKLFMSSRNLNLITKNILQQSVSEIIEIRKLTEAKNLLVSTDKSISEISFELGYNEKSYFSNVFKKKTGQTPTEFREEMRALIS